MKRLAVALALGAALPGCAPAHARVMDFTFDTYEVPVGDAARSKTVLTGFFLGGATAELVVVHLDENDVPRVRMFTFDDGAWTAALDAALRPDVVFVDVADIGGRDRLITYGNGRLSAFDPDSVTERRLLDITTTYNDADEFKESPAQPGVDIPHVDITRDLNRDGRDDLVLPDIDGFWISTQSSDGSFPDPVKLGPPEPLRDVVVPLMPGTPRSYAEVGITPLTNTWYQRRLHEMDYDHDGRNDLVFWNGEHFDVHRQDDHGRFDPIPTTFVTDVPFDSDGAYSLAADFVGEDPGALLLGFREKTRRTVLDSLQDVNGDGVADLVTQSIEGRSLIHQRRRFDVHFGSVTPEGVRFTREVGASIRPRGKAGGLQLSGYASQQFSDLDGDGQLDAAFRDVKISLIGAAQAMVGHSIPIDLEFFRMEDGVYPEAPATRRKIRRFDPFADKDTVFFPAVLMGDVNGDGRSDLLVGHGPEELHVFVGVPGPDLLAEQPQKVAISLPHDERNNWLVDINRDGKQDIVMLRGHSGPHLLTTLISRSPW